MRLEYPAPRDIDVFNVEFKSLWRVQPVGLTDIPRAKARNHESSLRKDEEGSHKCQRATKRTWETFRGKPMRGCVGRLVVECEGKEESRMVLKFSFGSGLDGLDGRFTNHIIENRERALFFL